MTSTTFFIIFIPILAVLLLAINLILAPHNPYQEKDSAFECGFHSFLGQNRTQFSVSFFIFALLFLLFDLEILLVYPYSVSSYTNDSYGLTIMMIFFVLLTLGFVFELGKNALTIDSRQTSSYANADTSTPHIFFSQPFLLLQSGFPGINGHTINNSSLSDNNGNTIYFEHTDDGEAIIYVKIVKPQGIIIFVPLRCIERVDFEGVSLTGYKGEQVSITQEDIDLAIKTAQTILKNCELCVCDAKVL
jgi:NADH-ubiquinone oxidoreductase chain 3